MFMTPAMGSSDLGTARGDLLSKSDEEKYQKASQKIIPDGLVDARLTVAEEPFAPPHSHLFGVQT